MSQVYTYLYLLTLLTCLLACLFAYSRFLALFLDSFGPIYTALPSAMRPKVGKPSSMTPRGGQLLHVRTQRRTAKQWATTDPHYWDMLHNARVTEWSEAVAPLSATEVPLHLTQFPVPFVQLSQPCVCKARDSIRFVFARYMNLYDFLMTCAMILGPQVNLIHCSYIQPGRLPNPLFD